MKIEALSPLQSTTLRRKQRAGASGGASFASELASEAGETQSVSGAGGVASMDSLLALQEVSDAPLDHRQAQQRGEELLAQLDDLRHALLIGAMPLAQLERLAQNLNRRRGEIADPRLAEVVQEVELRAAVELAKLGH